MHMVVNKKETMTIASLPKAGVAISRRQRPYAHSNSAFGLDSRLRGNDKEVRGTLFRLRRTKYDIAMSDCFDPKDRDSYW